MTKTAPLSRPAIGAIAAFLALSAPVAFAQTAPTDTAQPTAVPQLITPPVMVSPVGPVATPAPQTTEPTAPQPVIQVPLDIEPEATAPAPKATERVAAKPPVRTERQEPQTRKAAPAPAPAARAAPVTDDAPLAETEATPVAAPVIVPAEPVAAPAPLPVERAAPADTMLPWEIAGGAAALLLLGGAGLAFARRRRTEHEAEDRGMSYEAMVAAEAVPYNVPRDDAMTQPQIATRSAPSFAPPPLGSMGRHEAMAMAGPTPDNPFATLSKRLTRARFLDRQERVAYDETLAAQKDMRRVPASAWEISERAEPAAAEQEVRRPEPARGRAGLRPGWSRQ